MKRFFLLLVFGLAVFAASPAFTEEVLLHLAADCEEISFEDCAPGSVYEESFHLLLKNIRQNWAVLVFTEKSRESESFLPCLSLEGPGITIEDLSTEARKFLEERSKTSEELIMDAKLLFKPDWTIPPGEYSFPIFFQYLPEDNQPQEPPLPIMVKIIILPTVELKVENEGVLRLTSGGSPGRYPLEGTLSLGGKSNAELWKIVLYSEGLWGSRGGFIPPSRIFKKVGDKYLSLEKGVEMGPFPGGKEVKIIIDELYVETFLEDQPDTYEGKLYFRCFLKNKGV